ncbi:MAG: ABC transporter substrate-binding protein [Rhodocyclaceae bacterium]|nr:MAG: ABC transporter substrate-binding protein [Rhodocyclaceae bacterium]
MKTRERKSLSRLACLLGAGLAASLLSGAALADGTIKVGLLLPISGPFAAYGKQIENGVRLYMAKNGNKVAGKTVELIVKDDTGVAPELSKRLAQEMIVKDNVDVLAGFGLTPSGMAVAPLSQEAKKPMVVMNAAASVLTTKSPYLVRVSHTQNQLAAAMAMYAARNNIKKVYTLVADFSPGHDAEKQFKKTFSASGGEVIGEVRTPMSNPDFSPFLQKIKDTNPDAVYIFLPPGEQTVNFVKGFVERGLKKSGIKLIGTADLTDDDMIDALGDAVLGTITSGHYSTMHKSKENEAYTSAYAKAYPSLRPSFMSMAGYDGMSLIYQVAQKTNGDMDAEKFAQAAKGLSWMSPRGKVAIDPETRDIIQTMYIRRVEKVGGKLVNVEIDDTIRDMRDPGKQ